MTLRKTNRQREILAEFQASPSVRLGSLAERFGVTKETIRRDIDELSARGVLARTYGGAVASFINYEPGLRERMKLNQEGRRRMAEEAVNLIAGSRVLMIDTGATMSHVCEHLATRTVGADTPKLTVLTNSLKNVTTLAANPSIHVIVCPGSYDDLEAAAFGSQTLEFVARFNADVFLTSVGGIEAEGATDANSDAVAVKRAMLRQSARNVFVVEGRKFNSALFERVCGLSEIDNLVTDEPVSQAFAQILRINEVRVHVAPDIAEGEV